MCTVRGDSCDLVSAHSAGFAAGGTLLSETSGETSLSISVILICDVKICERGFTVSTDGCGFIGSCFFE